MNTNQQEQFDNPTETTAQELIDLAWSLLEEGRVADAIVVGKKSLKIMELTHTDGRY